MKPFNLEEYLKNPSRKIVTRDGRKARIICTDAKSKDYPIVALIKSQDEKEEYSLRYTVNGQYCPGYEKLEDLFFAPERHEGWINLYKNSGGFLFPSRIYQSKEVAEKRGSWHDCYVTTTKIEWEE